MSDEKQAEAATLVHFYTTEIIPVTLLTSHAGIEHVDGAAGGGDECQGAWGRPAWPVSLDPSLRNCLDCPYKH
jgi:hypothetical protein